MAISTDYSSPVMVNGYACKNCTDVANAKKHVDPAHPKSGPFGVNADSDPSRINDAVRVGGQLVGLAQADKSPLAEKALGSRVDVRV